VVPVVRDLRPSRIPRVWLILASHNGGDRSHGRNVRDDVWSPRHLENDLANLKGIGPRYADIHKSIGVDSIKEFHRRNAAHLKEAIESRHGHGIGLFGAGMPDLD
jgi:Domain of unknown function (DUF4332)